MGHVFPCRQVRLRPLTASSEQHQQHGQLRLIVLEFWTAYRRMQQCWVHTLHSWICVHILLLGLGHGLLLGLPKWTNNSCKAFFLLCCSFWGVMYRASLSSVKVILVKDVLTERIEVVVIFRTCPNWWGWQTFQCFGIVSARNTNKQAPTQKTCFISEWVCLDKFRLQPSTTCEQVPTYVFQPWGPKWAQGPRGPTGQGLKEPRRWHTPAFCVWSFALQTFRCCPHNQKAFR